MRLLTTRFATAIVLFLLASPFGTAAAQSLGKPFRVVVLWPTDVVANPLFDGFVHGLRDLGWVEMRATQFWGITSWVD